MNSEEAYWFGQKSKTEDEAREECKAALHDLEKARASAQAAWNEYELALRRTQAAGMGGVGYDGAGYSTEYSLALTASGWEISCELRYSNACTELEKWGR